MIAILKSERYPALSRIINEQIAAFPAHIGYLEKRFADNDVQQLEFDEATANLIQRITQASGGLTRFCEDYKFLTEIVLEEEIYFRREGRYRLATFAEAERLVYANRQYMTRYMNGLLLTQLWWRNHSQVLRWYCDKFLARNAPGAAHLEIGPGHGLYFFLAATSAKPSSVTAWDVSQSSIDLARHTLTALEYSGPAQFHLMNMFEATQSQFGSITFSEVLEHLEDPAAAMRRIAHLLSSGGRVFVHAPVNSPAPDHLSLFRSPEEIVALIAAAGLEIERTLFAPNTTARTLDNARKRSTAISVAVIGKKQH